MENEFATYKQALTLKELGFDEPCLGYYDGKGTERVYYNNLRNGTGDFVPFVNNERLSWFGAPLKSQVFRWFREKHKQSVYPIWRIDNSWDLHIQQLDGYGLLTGRQALHVVKAKTYEEAEDACIDKLIEIVKENK